MRSVASVDYRYVSVGLDEKARVATLTVRAPEGEEPETPAELACAGCDAWAIRAFRELDDALLDLRFNRPLIGVIASVLVLGERPTAADITGFALILAASALTLLSRPSTATTASQVT